MPRFGEVARSAAWPFSIKFDHRVNFLEELAEVSRRRRYRHGAAAEAVGDDGNPLKIMQAAGAATSRSRTMWNSKK